MDDVHPAQKPGQEAAHLDLTDPEARRAWGEEMRSLVQVIRALSFDGVAPRGERQHSRQYLRRTLRTRLRAMEARINLVAPPS